MNVNVLSKDNPSNGMLRTFSVDAIPSMFYNKSKGKETRISRLVIGMRDGVLA